MTGFLHRAVRLGPPAAAALAALAAGAVGSPASALDLGDGRVHLRHEVWSVADGPSSARERSAAPAPEEVTTWILVAAGPAEGSLRRGVEASGARIVGAVPSNAFLVRATPEQADALRSSAAVARVEHYPDAWKISPDIGTRTFRDPARLALGGRLLLEVHVFDGEDPGRAAGRAAADGREVLAVHGPDRGNRFVVVAEPEALPALAAIPEVEWIEERPEVAFRNDKVRWIIQSNVTDSTPLYDRGLFGAGEIIGHLDGEIQDLSCFFQDPVDNTPGPLHRKLVSYRSSGSTVGADHGTHTAGTAAGDREPVNGSVFSRGMAPKARLAFGNVNDVTGLGDTASNLLQAFQDAHADGARVHTNSWGELSAGTYTTWSVDVDTFARQNEDDLVVFAVINGGAQVISPENAKNCLAVAATDQAGLQDFHASGAPGPTFDGRRKPEVMAPGRNTVSSWFATSCGTAALTGTSMAAPAVAGGAALVREYLRRGFHDSGQAFAPHSVLPTGALLKAIVVNSAVDLTGEPGYPGPYEGWGRILLDDALYFPGDARRLWFRDVRHAQGLGTGGVDRYRVEVLDPLEPLKVTLVFTDQPAVHGAALAPVNDLDLEIEGPDGTFLGNVFDTVAGQSVAGGAADPLNNVERVVRALPTPGTWHIRVRGADVPMGPQGYAVVVNGGIAPARAASFVAPDRNPPPEDEPGEPPVVLPDGFRLDPLAPSPFRGRTEVRFAVPRTAPVRIDIFDVTGRRVRTLMNRTVDAGEYRVNWDGHDEQGRGSPPGIYFARLTAPGTRETVRGVLLR